MKLNAMQLAIWLHNNYEEIAIENNWDTQKDCKVGFWDLPEANQKTMIELAIRLNKMLYPSNN